MQWAMLVNSKFHGIIGGDWNYITSKDDCNRHTEAKMSPCLKRLIREFSWSDTFRHLYPNTTHFSHYYGNMRHGEGATSIDRSYSFGDLIPLEASYVSVAFYDHLSYITQVTFPNL